jgi:hypothetical protein
MSGEQLPKDAVTLDDLKRAMDEIPPNPRLVAVAHFADIAAYDYARAKAWRTAFEWRDYFGDQPNRNCQCKSCRDNCAEYDEGLRLIREKLQS